MSDVAPRTRLDEATKLATGTYALRFYPRCGEAVVFRPMVEARRQRDKEGSKDPEASAVSAGHRARTMVRRLATEHRLSRMVTLTNREKTAVVDRDAVVRAVGLFIRRLRREFPGIRYIYALELHPGGHGWHVHMLVDRYMAKNRIAACWGHGFVDVRRHKGRDDGASPVGRARKLAAYLAKYIAKALDENRSIGRHRYERAQGMSVTCAEGDGEFDAVVTWVFQQWGGRVCWSWWSGDDDEWRGPRTFVLRSG